MSNPLAQTLIQVDLAVKTGIGIAAQKDLERIRSEAALRTQFKQVNAPVAPLGDGALRDEADLLFQKVQTLEVEIAHRDMMILDWMHSNEVFKRLQKNYGKKLGLSDEQRQFDFNQAALDIAEENPKFAKSHFGKVIKARVK